MVNIFRGDLIYIISSGVHGNRLQQTECFDGFGLLLPTFTFGTL
jgi:hypothetical protein